MKIKQSTVNAVLKTEILMRLNGDKVIYKVYLNMFYNALRSEMVEKNSNDLSVIRSLDPSYDFDSLINYMKDLINGKVESNYKKRYEFDLFLCYMLDFLKDHHNYKSFKFIEIENYLK